VYPAFLPLRKCACRNELYVHFLRGYLASSFSFLIILCSDIPSCNPNSKFKSHSKESSNKV
jgi:hypothetical protein